MPHIILFLLKTQKQKDHLFALSMCDIYPTTHEPDEDHIWSKHVVRQQKRIVVQQWWLKCVKSDYANNIKRPQLLTVKPSFKIQRFLQFYFQRKLLIVRFIVLKNCSNILKSFVL